MTLNRKKPVFMCCSGVRFEPLCCVEVGHRVVTVLDDIDQPLNIFLVFSVKIVPDSADVKINVVCKTFISLVDGWIVVEYRDGSGALFFFTKHRGGGA